MTVAGHRAHDTTTATETVAAFFDAYRAHNVNAMVALCAPATDFRYVPVERWGEQRVLRAAGKVRTVGKPLRAGSIAAFPDLTNTVGAVTTGPGSDVAAEVVIARTQLEVD